MNVPKRSAPGREIAGAAKLRLAQDNSGHSFAQACKHSATRTERRPEPAAFGAPHPIRRTNPNSKKKKQMKISKIFPSRWLKAIDLEADGETVTIRKLTMEEVGEERERKPVMSFEEIDRKLVLNVTNANAIADVTGKDDSDDWPGQVIKLVRCKVQFGAKTVDAIRIEAPDEPGGRSPTNSVPKQQAAEVEREVEMPY